MIDLPFVSFSCHPCCKRVSMKHSSEHREVPYSSRSPLQCYSFCHPLMVTLCFRQPQTHFGWKPNPCLSEPRPPNQLRLLDTLTTHYHRDFVVIHPSPQTTSRLYSPHPDVFRHTVWPLWHSNNLSFSDINTFWWLVTVVKVLKLIFRLIFRNKGILNPEFALHR